MDPDQQLRNVSHIHRQLHWVYLQVNMVWWWVCLSLVAAGFPPGLQPHDWDLLPAMHQQLQLQKPHHGRGMTSSYLVNYNVYIQLRLWLWLICPTVCLITFSLPNVSLLIHYMAKSIRTLIHVITEHLSLKPLDWMQGFTPIQLQEH